MTEIERIQEELRRTVEGDAWHGPSLRQVLAGVTAEMALARPIPTAHSIWELVLHIRAWAIAVRRRIGGDDRAELSDEENFPPATGATEEEWSETIGTMEEEYRLLAEAAGKIDEAHLDLPAMKGMSPVYFQLHGVVEHGIYHAGQIIMLRKALETQGGFEDERAL